jgi:hypothetical protein
VEAIEFDRLAGSLASMLNFSVVETIQMLKRRRIHFENVVAGLATLDDCEIAICTELSAFQVGRSEAADFGQRSPGLSSFSPSDGAGLIIKQLDTALTSLRDCMFDDIGGERIISDVFEAKARKAIEQVDPRLFSVPLLSRIQPRSDVAAQSEFLVSVAEDHRLSKFKPHHQLRRHSQLPLVDTTSCISACIPGWPAPQASDTLPIAASKSALPSFLRALESAEECVYGARRHEGSTWMQKHKRSAPTK